MKDRPARALAIAALVFMGIFLAALIATIVDRSLLNGAIGFVALGSAVMTLIIFFALKADGRGFSMTKINNDIEMQKIEKEAEEQKKRENEEADKDAQGGNTAAIKTESERDTDV